MTIFKRKATYRELQELTKKLEALTAAHDSIVDVVATELRLCVAKSFYWPWGIERPDSPRAFAVETTKTLTRCPKKKKGQK